MFIIFKTRCYLYRSKNGIKYKREGSLPCALLTLFIDHGLAKYSVPIISRLPNIFRLAKHGRVICRNLLDMIHSRLLRLHKIMCVL